MLTKEKSRAVLSSAFFVVVGIMIITSGAFASMSIDAFASTSSDIFIVSSDSGAEVKTMKLKAVKEDGEVRKVSGFAISIENVVSVQRDGKVTVFSAPTSPDFTSAKLTDTDDRTVEIPITDAGVISLEGYSEGVYTLDVIVEDRFAFECVVVIGPEEVSEETINKEITVINKRTDEHVKKIFVSRGINKARVCLFTPSHPICKPDKNGNCPPGWAMNEDEQCYPRYLNCPPGYWRADDDETGACVPLPRILRPLLINDSLGGNITGGTGNITDTGVTPRPNVTDITPEIPPINVTEPGVGGGGANETIIPELGMTSPPFFVPPDSNITEPGVNGGDGGGGPNMTEPAEFEPLIQCGEGERIAADGLSCEPIVTEYPVPPTECPEGEQLSSDGLSCEPIVTEEPTPAECPEGEQPTADGLGCEPIMAEEPVPVECGEGEELVDGECQVIPTEEEITPEEEEPEEEEPEEEEPEEEEPADDGEEGGQEGTN